MSCANAVADNSSDGAVDAAGFFRLKAEATHALGSTRGVYCARVGWISRRGSADEANLRDRRRIAGGPVLHLTHAGRAARPVVPGGPDVAQPAAESLAARIGHRRHGRLPRSHLDRAPGLRLDDGAH